MRAWARAFRAALSSATDLGSAHALIVVRPDGSLTLISSPELDRGVLAQALVELAFSQVDTLTVGAVATQREASAGS